MSEHDSSYEHAEVVEADMAPGPVREHDQEVFDSLDKGFSKSVLLGYIAGVFCIFLFMFLALNWAAPDIPMGARIGASVGVCVWIGIMGGVIAVGRWTMKHESDLFHG
jgi:hypothetical protein